MRQRTPITQETCLPLWGRWPSEARSERAKEQHFQFFDTFICNCPLSQPFGLPALPEGEPSCAFVVLPILDDSCQGLSLALVELVVFFVGNPSLNVPGALSHSGDVFHDRVDLLLEGLLPAAQGGAQHPVGIGYGDGV